VMVFAGQLLSSQGTPAPGADPDTWTRWALTHEGTIENGAYYLGIPGLLLFLVLAAALAELQPAGMPRRLTEWGAVTFVILMTVATVLSSTTSSTYGFFDGFEDGGAVTLLTGLSAGFHLMIVAEWAIALTMLASGIGLSAAGHISARLRTASIAWAVLTAATGAVGFGLLPALLWVVAVSTLLVRQGSRRTPAGHPVAQALP
jgi:hypothetical protein